MVSTDAQIVYIYFYTVEAYITCIACCYCLLSVSLFLLWQLLLARTSLFRSWLRDGDLEDSARGASGDHTAAGWRMNPPSPPFPPSPSPSYKQVLQLSFPAFSTHARTHTHIHTHRACISSAYHQHSPTSSSSSSQSSFIFSLPPSFVCTLSFPPNLLVIVYIRNVFIFSK